MKMRRIYVAVLFVVGTLGCGVGEGSQSGQGVFTTRDSISMVRFNEPAAGRPEGLSDFSPNHRYATVMTSRGLLASNEIETTIWLLDTRTLADTLAASQSKTAYVELPRAIARIAATPRIPTFDTYAPVISDLRWSEDSKKLYFLGMDSGAERRLYEVDIRSGVLRALSPAGRDVLEYSLAGARIAYTARQSYAAPQEIPWSPSEAIDPDAGAVTGLGLERILYPEGDAANESILSVPDLWVSLNGYFRRVPNAAGRPPQPDPDHYFKALALSPDGHMVIRLVPVTRIDPTWSRYVPKPGFESWKIDPNESYLTSPSYLWRLREYELVDTASGAEQPLIRGPFGSSLAEEDAPVAVWSKDGRRVLVGNVGLPLNSNDPQSNDRREHICAVAAVDVPSLGVHCIAFSRDASAVIARANPHPLRLASATFGATDDDVTARFAWHGRWGESERYHFNGKRWAMVSSVPGNPLTGVPLSQPSDRDGLPSIYIEQGLNSPPTLWASLNGKSMAIWNPNPRLGTIDFAKASLFHWTDQHAYGWEGVLLLPAGYQPGKRYPLVIQTHGYLPSEFVTEGLFPTAMAARELSSAGFVVLQTGNRSDHYVSLQEAEDAIDQWRSAIAELDRDGIIDSHRVGIIGFSRTCWYVERALIEYPQMFAAATLADGLDTSYMTYRLFAEGRPSMAKEYVKIIGSKPSGPGLAAWVQSAPGFHLDRVETPLRIEAIGPISVLTEWETYASLRDAGKPVDLIYIPGGQHILQKPWDRMASEQGNVDWFRFWLESYRDSDPHKAAQYARWSRMQEKVRQRAGPK